MNEQRRFPRVAFFCPLQLQVAPGAAPIEASAIDLGLGGVGALIPTSLEIGHIVTVTFLLPAGAEQVVGRLAHFAADVDANRIGIQFLSPISEQTHPHIYDKLIHA